MVATRNQKTSEKRDAPAAAVSPRAKRPRKCKEPQALAVVANQNEATAAARPVAKKARKSSKKKASKKQAPAKKPPPPPPKKLTPAEQLAEAQKTSKELEGTLSNVLGLTEPFVIKQFQSVKGYGPLLNERWVTFSAWREQEEVCLAALNCGLDPDNLANCEIFGNVSFLVKAIAHCKNKKQGQKLWNMILDRSDLVAEKNDKNRLYFAAFGRGLIDKFTQLPSPMQKNKKLLIKAIEDDLCPWKKLPATYRKDVDFALAARKSVTFSTVVRSVTDKETLFKKWACVSPKDLNAHDWELAPSEIVDDANWMVKAISKNLLATRHIGGELATDIEFVERVLAVDVLSLCYFPDSTYTAFPNIINIESVQKFVKANTERGQYLVSTLKSVVPSAHWRDREFVLAWVQNGNDAPETVERTLPEECWSDREFVLEWCKAGVNPVQSTSAELRDDEGIWMALAKSKKQWKSYDLMSERLRNDKDFLRGLLEFARPNDIMSVLPQAVKDDEELKIACLAGKYHENLYHIFDGSYTERIEKRNRLREKIRGWTAAHKGFVRFLCGTKQSSGSPLEMLEQHVGIKRNIASFLFPQGPTLTNVFKAAKNLGFDSALLWQDEDDLFDDEDDIPLFL